MRAIRGLQIPQATTTVSVPMTPGSVWTPRTWPFSTSMPVTSTLAKARRAPSSCAFSRMSVPARSESTTPTPGVENAPRMTFSSMNGTRSRTSRGVSSSTGSTPHDLAEAMRRLSSSRRWGVLATSTPPLTANTPSSSYWRTLSTVNLVISLEWSTRKMKFEAWPVEPPGLGNGPLSSSTMSFQPCSASW